MKALEITKHKTNLTNILIDIYKDGTLGSLLGFKGGTAAMLFYDLPRFSVDLDFDLTKTCEEDSDLIEKLTNKMSNLFTTKYTILDHSKKYNTLFWVLSYGENLSHIKVEISTRDNPYNHFDLKSFYGVKIKILDVRDMIAHKMVAVMERTSIANRDLFDIHYFLGTHYAGEINYDITRHRTGLDPKEFYEKLLNFVSQIEPKSVLTGLGELIDESKKDWAKAKLIDELKGLINRQIDIVS